MFLLISFALANNYCIEKTKGRCQTICQNLPEKIDNTFSYIPNDFNINTSNNEKHDIYIADQVDYQYSSHNFIFCDPSIHLIYKEPIKNIKLKDHIYINSSIMLKDAPILFQFKNDLRIEIYSNEKKYFNSIILESFPYNNLVVPVFFSDNFPENLILISSNSLFMKLYNITDNVKKVFNTTQKFLPNTYNYFCISDKENTLEKCSDYSSYSLNYLNSTLELDNYYHYNKYVFIIIDTTLPQILYADANALYQHYHIIGLENSDVTFYPNYQPRNGDFYTIINSDSIEMPNLYFEGKGRLTLATSANISLLAKTANNNNHFTLKAKHPFVLDESCIHSIDENSNFLFNNKIQIADYCAFVVPKNLAGLFEQGKYFLEEDFNSNIDVSSLKEYQYDYVTYYFKKGDHKIPSYWKKPCRFQGIAPEETNFIFEDVHYYDGKTIDNFIDVNYKPSKRLNRITIKPSSYFYLDSFGSIYNPELNEKYTIQVDESFIMYGPSSYNNYDIDEMAKDQCKIAGHGTIKFIDSAYMEKIRNLCQIDENIETTVINSPLPYFQACIGQKSFGDCKSLITDADSSQNSEWIWVRNIKTLQKLRLNNNPVYVTDDQIFYDYDYNSDYNNDYYKIILTSNANLLIPYNSGFELYKNGIANIEAQSPLAKLTIFYNSSENNYDYHFDFIDSSKQSLYITYRDAPTDIDFQIYFHYENTKLFMKYLKNYNEKSIKLTGKTVFYYRKPYKSQMSMFDISDNIKLILNTDLYYDQICYSDEPVESDSLYDFVLASNIEEFNNLKKQYVTSYIYKDINLSLNSSNSFSRYFYFYNNISVTIDLPNNTYFLFDSYYCRLIFDRYTEHYLYYNSYFQKFSFDIKDYIILDYEDISSYTPVIEFTSSKSSVEVFPNPSLKYFDTSFDYTISVPNGFTIYSPVPSYLKGIFGSTTIEYSSKWSYFYLSDIKKTIDQPFQLITHHDFENDENLPQNIVLMIDPNDKLSIPANWKNVHNIYYQGDLLNIENPTDIRYQIDSVVLDSFTKIVAGNLSINVPTSFTVNINDLNANYYLDRYMYDAILNCSLNSHTDLYINATYYPNSIKIIKIYGNNEERSLYINADNENELYYFNNLLYLYSDVNVKYIVDYNYICYNSNYYDSVCSEKFFHAAGIESLLNAVKDYPGLPIIVAQDLTIPYSTGYNFLLHPINENIQINLPYSPRLMTITDKENINFEYYDSTIIEITNKSKIEVNLNRPLEFNVESNINSLITFNLGSDVLISTQKDINEILNIQLNENSYGLYSENIDRFGLNFRGKINKYYKICAYEEKDAESLCLFTDKNTIENIFHDNFYYNEVELALSSQSYQMILPSIKKQAIVNILPSSNSILTIQKVSSLEIEPDMITINEYWKFIGDLSRLSIELGAESILSITGTITNPITLKLTSINSVIDLYDCDEQNNKLIKLLKFGNSINSLTILGTDEIFNNLKDTLIEYNDISLLIDKRQKYLCVCNDENSYAKCQGGINGIFKRDDSIKKDPGRAVNIRIFSNVEIPMNIFKKEHDAFIDYEYHVNLTHIKTVYQNIDEGLKIEKLTFINGTNLLLKPRERILNIWMREFEPGPYFTIDIDKYLGLRVPNIDNQNSAASRIHTTGNGELNVLDYPFERIRASEKVRLIKGIYIICGTSNGNSICSYESDYKKLNNYNNFENDFDQNSKIIVFLNSFSSSMDVRMNRLNNQKIQFVRTSYSKTLLDNQNSIRLRFVSTSELIGKSDFEIGLSNSYGGVSLNSSDSDLFVVGFDDTLTIKQEDSISKNLNGIVIQPFNDKATINIDESVDLFKQKLKIETENNKPVSITIISNNKNIDQNQINKLFDYDPKKVAIEEVIIKDGPNSGPKSNGKKEKITTKSIIAIVIVCSIVVVVAIIGVIFAVRAKRKNKVGNSTDDASK